MASHDTETLKTALDQTGAADRQQSSKPSVVSDTDDLQSTIYAGNRCRCVTKLLKCDRQHRRLTCNPLSGAKHRRAGHVATSADYVVTTYITRQALSNFCEKIQDITSATNSFDTQTVFYQLLCLHLLCNSAKWCWSTQDKFWLHASFQKSWSLSWQNCWIFILLFFWLFLLFAIGSFTLIISYSLKIESVRYCFFAKSESYWVLYYLDGVVEKEHIFFNLRFE